MDIPDYARRTAITGYSARAFRGKRLVFRIKVTTRPELGGLSEPRDGKPLGKEIKKRAFGTTTPPTARKRRDMR